MGERGSSEPLKMIASVRLNLSCGWGSTPHSHTRVFRITERGNDYVYQGYPYQPYQCSSVW